MPNQAKIMKKPLPKHIAIIMDGNGRWAKRHGLPREDGHKAGALTLKKMTLFANQLGVECLSVYAFSTENWSRPQEEVDQLMKMPKVFENEYQASFDKNDIRVVFSGRRDRFKKDVADLLDRVEKDTQKRQGMILNVCIDYGAKDEITAAAKQVAHHVKTDQINLDDLNESVFNKALYTYPLPDVDLLIRTSGEQRLSNFLLWQSAYAEFHFTKVHWPAFKARHLLKAIADYQGRQRKFGGRKGHSA